MSIRLSKAFKEFNISLDRAVEYFASKGIDIDRDPNVKITDEQYALLAENFGADKQAKAEAAEIFGNRNIEKQQAKEEAEAARKAAEEEAARKAAEEAAARQAEEAARKAMVYHKVRNGENLGSIARKYHTSVNAICRLNGIKETSVLRLGQKIRVR